MMSVRSTYTSYLHQGDFHPRIYIHTDTNTHADRQTDRRGHRHTCRQTQTDRQTGRQAVLTFLIFIRLALATSMRVVRGGSSWFFSYERERMRGERREGGDRKRKEDILYCHIVSYMI
jgi:hypothetical protein